MGATDPANPIQPRGVWFNLELGQRAETAVSGRWLRIDEKGAGGRETRPPSTHTLSPLYSTTARV